VVYGVAAVGVKAGADQRYKQFLSASSTVRTMSGNWWGESWIIGRELRYDTSLLLRADIDFCLSR